MFYEPVKENDQVTGTAPPSPLFYFFLISSCLVQNNQANRISPPAPNTRSIAVSPYSSAIYHTTALLCQYTGIAGGLLDPLAGMQICMTNSIRGENTTHKNTKLPVLLLMHKTQYVCKQEQQLCCNLGQPAAQVLLFLQRRTMYHPVQGCCMIVWFSHNNKLLPN